MVKQTASPVSYTGDDLGALQAKLHNFSSPPYMDIPSLALLDDTEHLADSVRDV